MNELMNIGPSSSLQPRVIVESVNPKSAWISIIHEMMRLVSRKEVKRVGVQN